MDEAGLPDRLAKLKQDTDDAIAAARDASINDSVNWGDLRCIDAYHAVNVDGDKWYAVEIEEVSPNAVRFRAFIRAQLEARGWSDVAIGLEW